MYTLENAIDDIAEASEINNTNIWRGCCDINKKHNLGTCCVKLLIKRRYINDQLSNCGENEEDEKELEVMLAECKNSPANFVLIFNDNRPVLIYGEHDLLALVNEFLKED